MVCIYIYTTTTTTTTATTTTTTTTTFTTATLIERKLQLLVLKNKLLTTATTIYTINYLVYLQKPQLNFFNYYLL